HRANAHGDPKCHADDTMNADAAADDGACERGHRGRQPRAEWLPALKRPNAAVHPIGGTLTSRDPFGIPSTSPWTEVPIGFGTNLAEAAHKPSGGNHFDLRGLGTPT